MRVLPDPVGPRNSRFPTGRPGEFNPAQNTWYRSTSDCTPSSCPTIFDFSAWWKSRVSLLRMLGSNCWRVAAFMASTLYGEPLASPLCLDVQARQRRVSDAVRKHNAWGVPISPATLQIENTIASTTYKNGSPAICLNP